MQTYEKIIKDFLNLRDDKQAKVLSSFFKTGKGQYGEGDKFLGIKAPVTRGLVKKYYKEASLKDVKPLIENPYHEVRLAGFLILVEKFQKTKKEEERQEIYNFYMANLKYANNWDLVDLSCYKIAGAYLHNKDHKPLYKLAKSKVLWQQRVAMISTMYFVKNGSFDTAFDLAQYFLPHKHDLMHKASGWILRELGKEDISLLYAFLDKHHKKMPRTMLRYSIEKLPQEKKEYYMKKD